MVPAAEADSAAVRLLLLYSKDRPLRAESFQDSESAPLHEKSRLHYPGVMQQTCTRKKPPEPIRFPAALEGIIELTCEAGD
ncbi:hypothetical protein ACFTAO_25760 [Paenibacillus rhizoplanae]